MKLFYTIEYRAGSAAALVFAALDRLPAVYQNVHLARTPIIAHTNCRFVLTHPIE